MLPFLQLTIALVIIITAAKIGGYLSHRLGQPAVMGEVLISTHRRAAPPSELEAWESLAILSTG